MFNAYTTLNNITERLRKSRSKQNLSNSTMRMMGANAKNIGSLMARKHVYFVPFRQDDPLGKPNSVVADFELIGTAATAALRGEQVQPVLLEPAKSG